MAKKSSRTLGTDRNVRISGQCTRCFSYAINHNSHGRDGTDNHLCDVCYWRKRAEIVTQPPNQCEKHTAEEQS